MPIWPWCRRMLSAGAGEAATGDSADPVRFFQNLAPSRPVSGYGPRERYRDFRAVFLDSPAGRRVLWQLFDWARVFAPATVPGDPYATHFRDGERNIGLRVLAALNAEPPEPPIRAEGERPRGEAQEEER